MVVNKDDVIKAIDRVNKGISDRDSLDDKKSELDVLIKEPKVIEYLNL